MQLLHASKLGSLVKIVTHMRRTIDESYSFYVQIIDRWPLADNVADYVLCVKTHNHGY